MNTLAWLSLILNATTLFYIIKHETFKEKQHDRLIKFIELRINNSDHKFETRLTGQELIIMHMREDIKNLKQEVENDRNVGDTNDCNNQHDNQRL